MIDSYDPLVFRKRVATMSKRQDQGPKGGVGNDYVFPSHLVVPEHQGGDYDAFREQKKFNSARPFDEREEGRAAMKKIAPAFFRTVSKALKVKKPGSDR